MSLPGLAWRNAGRNPGRSTLTIALMAVACFLIIALSAFRLAPTAAGTGGFDLLADSAEPVFADLNSPEVRRDLLADDARLLQGGTVLSLRVLGGDDASCNNLYRPSQPRVLGVPSAMVRYFDDPQSHRLRLQRQRGGYPARPGQPVAVAGGAAGRARRPGAGRARQEHRNVQPAAARRRRPGVPGRVRWPIGPLPRRRLVGQQRSAGQPADWRSRLLAAFSRGQRLSFLPDPGSAGRVGTRGGRVGGAAERPGVRRDAGRPTAGRSAGGAEHVSEHVPGVGCVGVAAGHVRHATVQVRNVLERRSELALLRAAGFRRRRLAQLVMGENIALLVGGLLTGAVAALLAVLPHMFLGGAAVPLRELAGMLAVVLVAGIVSSLFSVRAALRAPLIAALRGD